MSRYIGETAIAKKFVQMIGEPEASKRLFASTFQGKVDEFFIAAGAAYRKLGDKQPDGKTKGFGDKAYKTDQEAGNAFKDKVKNWSEVWLKPRLPV